MDLYHLNQLLKKIAVLNTTPASHKKEARMQQYIGVLKRSYGDFLVSQLFEIYDEYFEDNEMDRLEKYIAGEVVVYGDEFEQEQLLVSIKPFPVRIELSNPACNYCNVIWEAA